MRFEVWQAFMDELGTYLQGIKARTGALIVWRTTFLVSGEGGGGEGTEEGRHRSR